MPFKFLENGALELARQDRIVLAFKENGEFVTWWTPEWDPQATSMGHYFRNIFDAVEDFKNRRS